MDAVAKAAPTGQPQQLGGPNWFGRHKLLTTLGAIVLIGAGISGCVDDPPEPTAAPTAARESPAASEPTDAPTEEQQESGKQQGSKHEHQQGSKHAQETRKPQVAATPESDPIPEPTPTRRTRTFLVVRVVDGDTIELGNGETVRVVGIDTPEVGQCGYDQATGKMERLVLGRQVKLTVSVENRDYYGRLLRYVDVGPVDAGLRQIKSGVAIARYDSRDGYGYHPREGRYIAADKATPSKGCPKPAPLADNAQQQSGGAGAGGGGGGCASGYQPCVPAFPPDVDCDDVAGPINIRGSDPHGLDADGDGVACET